jgi:ubiquinone/menaquinone biosynthesis C-methylase UbiE
LNSGSSVKVLDMTTTQTATALPPNHHADHPSFSGVGGLVAALGFNFGRGADAELAVRLAGVGDGDDVVDIGCGPGVAVRRAGAAGATSVIGVDPAAVMLRVARLTPRAPARHRATLRYLRGAAESLPLADGVASVAWSLATVHHWRDLAVGLAEVRRVLRPGGRFLALERLTVAGATGVASHGWTEDQANAFADCCRDAGFTAVTVQEHRTRRAVLVVLASC